MPVVRVGALSGEFNMRKMQIAVSLAATLSLAGCSSFIGGELVREGEPVGQVTIVNNSGITMNVVTISRCSAMSHGLNVLNSGETIRSGTSRSWAVNAGCWDIGVGRTGTCTSQGCSWNEDYAQVNVPTGRNFTIRWGPAGHD